MLAPNYHPPMQTLRLGTLELELSRIPAPDGSTRTPIVFLHEGLGSVSMWREWPRDVCSAAQRGGFVYSRQGYGRSQAIADVRGSGRLKPDYMHREALEVLPRLLEELGIDKPVLLGHSDGGTIALIHAAHFPVTACIVMAPHVVVEDVSVQAIEQARVAYETTDLRSRLARYHADVDSAFWQWNDIWLDPAFRSFDIRAECRRIHAPVLALQGRDDAYGTLRQIEEIEPAGAIRREVLEQCGHSPHKDQPQASLEAVTRFLAYVA
jgi:pimeloyl-ACP methyl ester carboxylesterase